ncbi:hypothetical protein GCM10007962_14780 [Yeosuana aromativorans]|uniref:Uncharacterized protein n=1 Tax=Yeosuana aromativorans TaxID=288019 RepID=A0A8J3BMG6_9FLAO|nr:hypothetical protein GCM10007962_14780 [Yeosuana aromativorans]
MALAPYSPILLGVNKDAVKEPKHCLSASLNDIFFMDDTKFCHFKISKNQLKMVKTSKKSMFFNKNKSFLEEKLTKSEKAKSLFFNSF